MSKTAARKPSTLLFDEPPLVVSPTLARLIGLEDAVVLQQLHYWLQRSEHTREGRTWVYNTYTAWLAQIPVGSDSTIRRIFDRLVKRGLILKGNYNRLAADNTLWWSIDYEALASLIATLAPSDEIVRPPGQNEQVGNHPPPAAAGSDGTGSYPSKLTRPPGQNEQATWSERADELVNLDGAIPETTPETTQRLPETGVSVDLSPVGVAGMTLDGPYSPYVAGVVLDHLAELGDPEIRHHPNSQAARACNLWHQSGLDEEAFVQHCHQARREARSGGVQVTRRGALYFSILTRLAVPLEEPTRA